MANPNGRPGALNGTANRNVRVATNGSGGGPKVDPSDPQVRKLVYNMYRGMLDQKHQRANVIVDSAPQDQVETDAGVGLRVESMMRQQSQLKGGGMNTAGAPPPPPPPPIPSVLPQPRLPTQIPARTPVMNPPAALAGAMLKDKKPFTYTPGGLDLSEINSPHQNGGEGADSMAPVQSRSFRVLQSVLSNQDVPGSDDETSNYMQQTKQQSHATVQQEETQQSIPKLQKQKSYKSVQNQGHPQSAPQKHSSQSDMPQTSRFFRMLQTLTDTLPEGAEPQGPVHIPNLHQQQMPSPQQQPTQYQPPSHYQPATQYQPPSHYQPATLYQQPGAVNSSAPAEEAPPEPKKYMGGSIPSRSFKILQAMTSADDVPGLGQSDL